MNVRLDGRFAAAAMWELAWWRLKTMAMSHTVNWLVATENHGNEPHSQFTSVVFAMNSSFIATGKVERDAAVANHL
jgi:hypothetical protein